MTWRRECEELEEAQPTWSDEGAPMCTYDECRQYDGKRCEKLGARPSAVCEPCVIRMADLLNHRTPS